MNQRATIHCLSLDTNAFASSASADVLEQAAAPLTLDDRLFALGAAFLLLGPLALAALAHCA